MPSATRSTRPSSASRPGAGPSRTRLRNQVRVVGEYGVSDGRYSAAVVRFDTGQTMTVTPASFYAWTFGGEATRVL